MKGVDFAAVFTTGMLIGAVTFMGLFALEEPACPECPACEDYGTLKQTLDEQLVCSGKACYEAFDAWCNARQYPCEIYRRDNALLTHQLEAKCPQHSGALADCRADMYDVQEELTTCLIEKEEMEVKP